MEYLFSIHQKDRKVIDAFVDSMLRQNKATLIENYNAKVENSLLLESNELLYMYALRIVFMKLFGASPIHIETDHSSILNTLCLGGKIKLIDETFFYEEAEERSRNKQICAAQEKSKSIKSNTIEIEENGELVIGEFIERKEYFIKIKIVSPYKGWVAHEGVNPRYAKVYGNFFTLNGERCAKKLLLNAYLKLKIIDENIDDIVDEYTSMEKEIIELQSIPELVNKANILKKIEEYFFEYYIFNTAETGLVAFHDEKEHIIKIIESYRDFETKIFISQY